MTEALPPTLRSVAAPLTASLLFTCAVVSLLCKPPRWPSLSWPQLIALALLDVFIALGAQTAILYLLRTAFPAHIELPARILLQGSWISAASLPLFVLLLRQHSSWSAAIPPLIVAPVVLFVRRWTLQERDRSETSTAAPDASLFRIPLFCIQEPPSFLHTVLPAALTSIALQAGATTVLLGYDAVAGLLFAACTLLPIWRYPIKPRPLKPVPKSLAEIRPMIRNLLGVALLTGIALLPFLKYRGLGAQMNAVLHTKKTAAAASLSTSAERKSHTSGAYSGVILYLPQKPRKQIIAPTSVATTAFDRVHPKPVIIPFDGVYWYFQPPDDRPKSDAHIVHGDPAKANVRSTDRLPIFMEAHQFLGSAVAMNCCRNLRVRILNADNRPGKLSLQVVLHDTATKGSVPTSLGTYLVPSSSSQYAGLDRHPVDETLTFPIPAHALTKQFDEITVVVKPDQERALVGAHIAIEQFALVP